MDSPGYASTQWSSASSTSSQYRSRHQPSTDSIMRFPESNVRNEEPNRNPAPQHTTPSQPPLISDLVNDVYNPSLTAEQLSRSEALSTSRHNPDFRARNRPKTTHVRDLLSDFHLLVLFAGRTEDQGLLNGILARLKAAAQGLPPLPQLNAPLAGTGEENGGEREMAGMPQVRGGDYWTAQHPVKDRIGSDVGSVGEMGDVAMEGLERERGWWEALENYHAKMEAIADAAERDEMSDRGLKTEMAGESQSQDTTLVEDEGEKAVVHIEITPATPEKAATIRPASSTPIEEKETDLLFRESRPLGHEILSRTREEVTSTDNGNC